MSGTGMIDEEMVSRGLSLGEMAAICMVTKQAVHSRILFLGLHDKWVESRRREKARRREAAFLEAHRGEPKGVVYEFLRSRGFPVEVSSRGSLMMFGVRVAIHRPRVHRSTGGKATYYKIFTGKAGIVHVVFFPDGQVGICFPTKDGQGMYFRVGAPVEFPSVEGVRSYVEGGGVEVGGGEVGEGERIGEIPF